MNMNELRAAALGMKRIVEEIDGAMKHGTWRDDNGVRLKDTPEWVALYNAVSTPPAPQETAGEAVVCLHGYCDAENCPACSQDYPHPTPAAATTDSNTCQHDMGDGRILTSTQPIPAPVYAPTDNTALVEAACHKMIVGFMLDCNAIGINGAAENLSRMIKERAAALASRPAEATSREGVDE